MSPKRTEYPCLLVPVLQPAQGSMPSWCSWQHTSESDASLQLLTLCLYMFFWQIIVVPTLVVKGSHQWLLLWPEQALCSSRDGRLSMQPLHLRSRQQGWEEGAAPMAAPIPASRGGMDTACNCFGAVVVYQVKACAVVTDAKVTPRSCYGPSNSWSIGGQSRAMPSEEQ